MYRTAFERMSVAGFELRSWMSNSEGLQEISKNDKKGVYHDLEYKKLLGYSYFPKKDVLKLSQDKLESKSTLTKRIMLSLLAHAYDPLGFVLPVLVSGEVLLRSLWLRKVEGDVQLPNDDVTAWKKLCLDLNKLQNLEFPRRAYDSLDSVDLIIFCDASQQMYGFVCYGRVVSE